LRAGGAILAVLLLLSALGPSVAPYPPLYQDRGRVATSPSLRAEQSGVPRHLLGTDELGRDVLSRTLSAIRYTFVTAVSGLLLTLLLGTVLGALAGLLGGLWDRLLMRTTELFMALPSLYLILGLRNLFPDALSALDAGLIVVMSLAAVGWSGVARLVRAQVLSIREQDYVVAALAAGASRGDLLRRHVLKVLRPYLLLQLGLYLPYFFLAEVTLSFLGLGLTEPEPSLGNMLQGAIATSSFLGPRWWTWLPPATLLTLAILGANLLLEGLRERYHREAGSGSGGVDLAVWATRASRLFSSSR
jgi:peptide/nickel transport system permease protein